MSQDLQPTKPEKPLGGRYKIISQLGAGGFGQTFLAEDLHLPGYPRCVIKQLKPQTKEPETLAMARRLFDTEAEVLYQLGSHDQIPRLLAHFEENQEFYLAQECVEGEPLTKELANSHPWTESQAIELLQDILQVLTFVHEQQVIHRDLKPSNLMRRKTDNKIVLIDFGAVKQVSSQVVNPETGETSLTISIGTKGYMPNEQLAGNPRFSSDVYAIGMLGLQVLTGLHPKRFAEDTRTSEIVWREHAPHVSSEMADILDKMVRYDFRDRYETAAEALKAFQGLPSPLQDSVAMDQLVEDREAPTCQELQPSANEAESTNLEIEPDPTSIWIPTQLPVQSDPANNDTTAPLSQLEPPSQPSESSVSTNAILKVIPRQWVKLWPVLAVVVAVGVTFVVTKTILSPQFTGQNLNRGGALADNPTPTPAKTLHATPKPSSRKLTAEELHKEGEKLKKAGQYEEALKFYDQAIDLKPKFAEAYGGRCYSLNKLEKFSEAMVACNDALDLKPKYPEAMWGQGNALQQQKRLSKALALYEQAIILKPKFTEAWVSRGMVYQEMGRYKEALWASQRAIDLERNSVDAWSTKGAALLQLGRWDEAVVALDKALELEPNHPRALKLREEARKVLKR